MAFGDEDLDAIFSESDPFAVLATFDVNGSSLEVYGQFTDATQLVNIISGDIEANDASITCRTSDIGTVKRDTSVTIGTTVYTVKRIQTVGTGASLVILKT